MLPSDVDALQAFAADYLSRPLALTVFQQLLPREILVRELTDIWHKAPVYARHLRRLRQASPIQAQPESLSAIAQ
jgi:hypothetical protein